MNSIPPSLPDFQSTAIARPRRIEGKRVLITLIADASNSMAGAPLRHVNQALARFRGDVLSAQFRIAPELIEIAVVRCAGERATVVSPFVPATEFAAPTLTNEGNTPLGHALLTAIETLTTRAAQLGGRFHRPALILASDGDATDPEEFASAAANVRESLRHGNLDFYAMVDGEDVRRRIERAFFVSEAERPRGNQCRIRPTGTHFGELLAFVIDSITNSLR